MKSLVTSLILMKSAIKNKKYNSFLKSTWFLLMSMTFESKGVLKFCFQILKEERLLFNGNLGFLIAMCSFYDIARQKCKNKKLWILDSIFLAL